MRKISRQFEIWGWHVKNSRWIYLLLAAFFLIIIPFLGLAFRSGADNNNYEMVYGYVTYFVTTLLATLGIVPLLLSLHGVYHLASGDCVTLSMGWCEQGLYLINYAADACVMSVMMLLLAFIYHQGISGMTFLRDLADFLVILWFMNAFSHFLTKLFYNVYFSLVLSELYAVLFWIILADSDFVLNVFSIRGEAGVVWLIRVVMYVTVGCIMEESVTVIDKVRR